MEILIFGLVTGNSNGCGGGWTKPNIFFPEFKSQRKISKEKQFQRKNNFKGKNDWNSFLQKCMKKSIKMPKSTVSCNP